MIRRGKTAVLVAVLAPLVTARVSALERADAPIIRGTPSEDAAVVALVDAAGGVLCSGTVIRPHVILTAAHCVSHGEELPYAIVAGDTASASEGTAVVRRLRHPEYQEQLLRADIALLGVADAQTAEPLELWDDEPAAGYADRPIRVVGYGCTDLTDAGVGTGLRRSLADTIVAATGEGKLRHGESTCVGDSGGPVFSATSAGDERILAVTSSGGADDEGPFALATPTPPYAKWVTAQADALESELAPVAETPGSTCGIARAPAALPCEWLILGLALAARTHRRARLCRQKSAM